MSKLSFKNPSKSFEKNNQKEARSLKGSVSIFFSQGENKHNEAKQS